MTDTSPRFALPFILPGQAQKEAYHNEALSLVDAALHPCVEGVAPDAPTGESEAGQSWIVSDSPTGSWSGRAGALATFTAGGWRFVSPPAGMLAFNAATGRWIYRTQAGWSDGSWPAERLMIESQQVVGPRRPAISSPSGGTVIDNEARVAIESLIATLKTHGLTD